MTMNDFQKQVIIAIAKNDMRVNRVSKAMCYSPCNIYYHIGRIKGITGLNPLNFFDLVKLYEMATGKGINNGEAALR